MGLLIGTLAGVGLHPSRSSFEPVLELGNRCSPIWLPNQSLITGNVVAASRPGIGQYIPFAQTATMSDATLAPLPRITPETKLPNLTKLRFDVLGSSERRMAEMIGRQVNNLTRQASRE
ncbi:hypothetical protein H9Q72_013822 [Fusarium xylarioides]|uniref:Uncharacterized protein n=1 Tax=Fusarium xylarioides TaxID=221167 RepID=A0A9P7HC11_9HYPO|nr:hypothetical protein H9Q72_013822 [Fusarium xylarioides]